MWLKICDDPDLVVVHLQFTVEFHGLAQKSKCGR